MALKPMIIKLLMVIAQLVLVYIYGLMGTIMTILLAFRLGWQRFFRRVERPTPPSQAMDPTYGKHNMITLKSSGVTLHYVSKGTSSQPLMLFVHGFPECWYSWRRQITHFSDKYHVVAIDQRGYGLSSKPTQVKDYRVEVLARDIADLVEQLGYRSCVLVGHDWGGIVSWATTILYPHLVEKLVILNCPHPTAFLKCLSFAQLRRSWYIFFYQIPWFPELLIGANDFGMFQHLFYDKPMGLNNKHNMTQDDLEVLKYSFSQKGATKAAINYYRALIRYEPHYTRTRIDRPVLIIWGCQDAALGQELADASQKFCSDARVKKIFQASHWVQQDEPEAVNRFIDEFLNE